MPPENMAQFFYDGFVARIGYDRVFWEWKGIRRKCGGYPENPIYKSRIQDLPVQESGAF